MTKFDLRRLCVCVCMAAGALVAGSALAQSVSYTGGTYTENFDSLPATVSSAAWSNGTTLNGWYAVFGPSGGSNTTRAASTTEVTTILVGTGSGSAGGFYSYGLAGDSDRALGSQANSTWEGAYALVIQNNTGQDMTSFMLAYDGEQWRRAGTAPQSLAFDFTVLSVLPAIGDLSAANVTNYTAVPALDFVSPISTGSLSAINGNIETNRTPGITATQAVLVPAGSYLVLRWWDNDDSGNDSGLAIDNLSFTATTAPAVLGACCDQGVCSQTRSSQCAAAGQTYQGDNTTCSPSPCAVSGGVCCRGATCNASVPQASCVTGNGALAGATFVATATTCGSSLVSPCCISDYNKSGALSVQDIFDFLNDWFGGRPYALMGGDGNSGTLAVQNIFDYLNAWFAGGC